MDGPQKAVAIYHQVQEMLALIRQVRNSTRVDKLFVGLGVFRLLGFIANNSKVDLERPKVYYQFRTTRIENADDFLSVVEEYCNKICDQLVIDISPG